MMRAVLIVVMVAITAVLSYVFSNMDIFLVSRSYLIAYVGVPAAFLLLASIGLWISRIREIVLMVLIPAGLALWMAEGWLAFREEATNKTFQRINIGSVAANKAGRPIDKRVQTTVLRDLRAEGVKAFPTFSPTTFLLATEKQKDTEWRPPMVIDGQSILPLTGVANARSIYCNESGQWLIFSSDRFGFNNPDEVWNQGNRKLAVLGDSFAQGACVAEGRGATDLLRAEYAGTTNLGIGGTGPLLQLAILKEFGPIALPETVVWFFYEGNDLHINLAIEGQFAFLKSYLNPNFRQGISRHAQAIDSFLREYIDKHIDQAVSRDTELKSSRVTLGQSLKLTRLRDRLGLTSCPAKTQDFALLKNIYIEGRRTVEQWGGRLIVVYLPAWGNQCDLFSPAVSRASWIHDGVSDAAKSAGLEVIDFASRMASEGDPSPYFFYPGSHYSDQGHALLAETVAQYLRKERKVP